ncbi:MAG: metal ABC transporter substrate-binding protein [Ruminococcus sp.]|nr:metal ABC transporter substrate-binding protein [Ruminococcus sp.]
MRRIFAVICCMIMLSGCGKAPETSDRINIVCTVFPAYDWVREIIGNHSGNFEITYLLANGSDMHSYQPTMNDIIKISSCDLFIYIGGESDVWAEDAASQAKNKNLRKISLLDSLGDSVKEEELKEGMQSEQEDSGEAEFDEHIWLSLGNAKKLCGTITEEICALDPDNASGYRDNFSEYCSSLDNLDSQYRESLSAVQNKTLVFGDRFPFRYLTDDYGLDYYAAFSGCSAETEASFETITFLADKIDELDINTIFTIEGADSSIAKAIVSATEAKNQNIVCLDSIQSVTAQQADNVTYLSIMQSNLDVLKEVLQ